VEVEEINLIAHSRGTDVLTSALRELYIETRADGHDFQTVYRIRNVVLAAADLDLEVITQRVAAEYMTLGVERATLYVSDVDRALGFAAFLFTSVHRLGQLRPEDLTDEERQHLARVARTQIIDFLADYSRLSRPPRHAGPLSDGRTGKHAMRPMGKLCGVGPGKGWRPCGAHPGHCQSRAHGSVVAPVSDIVTTSSATSASRPGSTSVSSNLHGHLRSCTSRLPTS
jgi:hypothetical protein